MIDSEFELFKGKNFKDLCRDIYTNQESKKEQIEVLISELRPLIKKVEDAMIVVPLIKDYLSISVSNDELLVRLAAVIQKIMVTEAQAPDGNPIGLSEAERKSLWDQVEAIKQADKVVVQKLNSKKE
jgi:hypothetical protein